MLGDQFRFLATKLYSIFELGQVVWLMLAQDHEGKANFGVPNGHDMNRISYLDLALSKPLVIALVITCLLCYEMSVRSGLCQYKTTNLMVCLAVAP